MKAKTWQDTVLTVEQLREKIDKSIEVGPLARKALELQTEIAFKAGKEQGWADAEAYYHIDTG